MPTTPIDLGVIAIVLSIISIIYGLFRDKAQDIRTLENRLATLEGNQFTSEDREGLRALEVKVGVFWNIIEKEAPRILKQHLTPLLDALLAKAENGIANLPREDLLELKRLLDERYADITNGDDVKDPGRALVLALYRGRLALALDSSVGASNNP
uniref:Uncharacterized protein n=1 Tax=viral metagenome TaxID=1070528 RepID=A0A6M3MGX8_9ZZZZ